MLMNTPRKVRKTASSKTDDLLAKATPRKAAGKPKKVCPPAGGPVAGATEARAPNTAPARRQKAPPIAAPAPSVAASGTKQSRLIAALQDRQGATVKDLVALTGWQPHTVRGTISSVLRKKLGYRIVASAAPDGRERRYRILEATGQ
jgi:hypothetical protein